MEELDNSVNGAQLEARKLSYSLVAHVWWPKLHASVSQFISTYDVYKKARDSTSLPTGLLPPLPIPTYRFTFCSMDCINDFLCHKVTMLFLCVWIFLTKNTQLIS